MKIRLGEPQFISIQGEGQRSCALSVWTRFFGCSLQCRGFFQTDPTDPSTYIDPIQGVEPSKYKSVFELPIVTVGCDSIYSIDPRFKHCAYDYTEESLIDELYNLLPGGRFKHPITDQTYDWCLTGGEPLMHQKAIVAAYNLMYDHDNFPYDIQVETNCTRALSDPLIDLIQQKRELGTTNWYFSMSPKLFTVAGEPDERAWFPEIIKQYWDINPNGWLKFVVNQNDVCWDELDRKVKQLRNLGIAYDIMVMPVGSTKEMQEDSKVISAIANRAIQAGYHVSGRLHCTIWGNTVGV